MRGRLLLGLALAVTLAGCSSDPAATPAASSDAAAAATSASADGGAPASGTAGASGTAAASEAPAQNLGDPSAAPPPADGGCDGSFGEGVVPSVSVTSGQNCVLNGTEVDGDITVQEGGSLTAAGVTVRGGITAIGGRAVTLNGVNVSGRTSIADSGTVSVLQSVLGELTLTDNTGAVEVSGNTLNGALTCEGNAQQPTGGQNQGGSAAGQCSGL